MQQEYFVGTHLRRSPGIEGKGGPVAATLAPFFMGQDAEIGRDELAGAKALGVGAMARCLRILHLCLM
jgi:hypothetical protein